MAGLSLEEILIRAPTEAAAFAAGLAIHPTLAPGLQALANEAWTTFTTRPLDAGSAASVAAEDVDAYDRMVTEASYTGLDAQRFADLYGVALSAPGLGELLRALRRGTIGGDDFTHGLRKARLETRWDAALRDLQHERLDLGALATAVHRGIVSDAGLLVTPVPSGSGNVPRIPVSSLDTLAEFAAQGIDPERARVLVADTGLPLSLGEMLRLLNMGVVTPTDVQVSIAESNVRNEYMDVALSLRRHLLTAHEWAEAELRGVKSHAEAVAGAGMVGLQPDDYATLFQILGRPLNVHDITKGLAHGVNLGGTYADVPEPYQDAIRRSSIRPEYARMAYANRYTYPSAFVLRSLTQSGEISEQDAHNVLLYEGWDPDLAAKVSAAWAQPAGAKADPWVGKADTQLWTATHKAYKGGEIGPVTAGANFDLIGIDATAQTEVLARWNAEKAMADATATLP